MPATRQMKAFKVKNQNGETITVNRRCFGSGTVVQKQLDTLVYDEQTKKFRMPDQDMVVTALKKRAKALAKVDKTFDLKAYLKRLSTDKEFVKSEVQASILKPALDARPPIERNQAVERRLAADTASVPGFGQGRTGGT